MRLENGVQDDSGIEYRDTTPEGYALAGILTSIHLENFRSHKVCLVSLSSSFFLPFFSDLFFLSLVWPVQNYRISFGPNLNIIKGMNGSQSSSPSFPPDEDHHFLPYPRKTHPLTISFFHLSGGKSSILMGIQFALGARSSVFGSIDSLTAFIRDGAK